MKRPGDGVSSCGQELESFAAFSCDRVWIDASTVYGESKL